MPKLKLPRAIDFLYSRRARERLAQIKKDSIDSLLSCLSGARSRRDAIKVALFVCRWCGCGRKDAISAIQTGIKKLLKLFDNTGKRFSGLELALQNNLFSWINNFAFTKNNTHSLIDKCLIY
jgi:hypothetical protein